MHARGRAKRARSDIEQRLHARHHRDHHRQAPIRRVVGAGRHPVDHFLLQHEVHVGDAGCRFEQVEQQRCRYVVGQVAADTQATARGERDEVDVERVGLVHDQLAQRADPRLQFGDHVAVDLDDFQASRAREQVAGQRAQSRSDLDQWLPGLRIDGRDDARDHLLVMQEVLAEALAGAYHRLAQSSASSSAAARLPASARPVPARSSAVPWSTDVRMIGRPSVTFTAWPKPAYLSTGRPWS